MVVAPHPHPYSGESVDDWTARANGRGQSWPARPIVVSDELEELYVRVSQPSDQAELHRMLARRGYVPELIAQDVDADYWYFYHPDGTR